MIHHFSMPLFLFSVRSLGGGGPGLPGGGGAVE